MKRAIPAYEEFFAWKLVIDDDRCQGVIAWDILNGGLKTIGAKTVILATGGAGRLYTGTTNAYACTGDGMARGARGAPRGGPPPPQPRRRAVPQALRAECDGARQPRRHLTRGADRDRRGPRGERQRPPRPAAPGRGEDPRAAPRDARALHGVRRGRSDQRADSGPAGVALPHGRSRHRPRRADDDHRPLRGGRVRVRLGARRESPRRERTDGDDHL